ncbi:cation:proton antiporter [Mycolicibacterium sp. P9-64]|uniref:cation:proton antiporter domain-containing protein n=1 Tax=Mycolicibacterium sp. P9-64 TaxID=2024612 RepID=UPI0032220C4B
MCVCVCVCVCGVEEATARPRAVLGAVCLLALTLVRMIPVVVALLGSTFSWHDRLLVGWLGPRDTTSIVFGLLAFNALPNDEQVDSLTMVVVVVLGSVVLHGLGAPAAARTYARLHPGQTGR